MLYQEYIKETIVLDFKVNVNKIIPQNETLKFQNKNLTKVSFFPNYKRI